METNTENKEQDLDDILNSTLEDFEELEKAGHFESTPTPDKSPIDFSKFVETFDKLTKNMKNQTEVPSSPSGTAPSGTAPSGTAPSGTTPSPGSEEEILEQMLKDLDNNSGYQGLVQGMMKQLLSKEVLYEPMKEMRDKYPSWLRDNKEKMQRPEWEKYCMQLQHIEEILQVYDNEGDQGFEKILKLMREMQECGHVPTDIVKQLAPDVEFDEEGQPKFPGMEALGNTSLDQCTIL